MFLHVAADGIVLELSNIPVYVGMCVFRYTHTYIHTHIYRLAWWLSDKRTLLPMQEMWVSSLDGEDPLEEEMATHSSILAWRIPWTEEPGGL